MDLLQYFIKVCLCILQILMASGPCGQTGAIARARAVWDGNTVTDNATTRHLSAMGRHVLDTTRRLSFATSVSVSVSCIKLRIISVVFGYCRKEFALRTFTNCTECSRTC